MIGKACNAGRVLLIILCFGALDSARAEDATVISAANAKGIVVLQASFLQRGGVHSFDLEIPSEEGTYVSAKVGPVRGIPFTGTMVRGAERGERTVLVLPVVGRFGLGDESFLFERAGTYRLRWNISLEDRTDGGLKIEQTVEVGRSTAADRELLARIGDRQFAMAMLRVNLPQRASPDALALAWIAAWLDWAQSDPSEERLGDRSVACGDALFGLAEELSESSYSAYAAYYAGGVFLAHLSQTPEGRRVSASVRDQGLYHKAGKALSFAVDHGDVFLKPRALCALAYLHECGAAWDEAAELLGKAVEAAPDQGAVRATVAEMLGELALERRSAKGRAEE